MADAADKTAKSQQVKVAVVATVTQQMDSNGHLVVCIEPTEEANPLNTQKIEDEVGNGMEQKLADEVEHIQFVRPLADGGFEILTENEAANLLEMIDDGTSHVKEEQHYREEDNAAQLTVDNNQEDGESAQIIISQDEDGQLLLEGTPLHFLLSTSETEQIQLIVENGRSESKN